MDVEAGEERLMVVTVGTEEEEAERIEAMLEMEVNVEGEGEGEGEEGGDGNKMELGALELLTQEAEPSGETLADTRNGFNELSHLEILWTVHHRWPVGARFAFNLYRH